MMADSLSIWTVTENPSDFPGKFVARRTEVGAGPTDDHHVAETLDEVRAMLPPDLIRMTRVPADDSVIVEVWF